MKVCPQIKCGFKMTANMRCVLISAESILNSSTQLNLISSCQIKREVNHVQTNQSILPDVPLFIGSHFNSRQRSASPIRLAIHDWFAVSN